LVPGLFQLNLFLPQLAHGSSQEPLFVKHGVPGISSAVFHKKSQNTDTQVGGNETDGEIFAVHIYAVGHYINDKKYRTKAEKEAGDPYPLP
jgi:hypothetical protein